MGSAYDASPSPPGADELYLYLSDLGPASPSAYLDLPPTPQLEPQPQGSKGGPAQDMLLPYISSMLMEDDIDGTFFYDYPDNAALLQAQQTFLDVLSSDDASSPTTTATTTSHSSASASLSHSSSDASGSAPLTPAAVDSSPAAQFDGFDMIDPAAFFSNAANSDLMSSAFLKGMEEASKFLPTQDKLVIDLDPPDDPKRFVLPTSAGDKPAPAPGFNGASPVPAAVAVKEEEVVHAAPDAAPGRGGGAVLGRGRRNRFDDDDEDPELQRRGSKQSALQGDGDEVDVFEKYIITDPDKCTEMMQNLRIAMQEEVAKQEAAAASGNGKAKGRRGGRDVAESTSRFEAATIEP